MELLTEGDTETLSDGVLRDCKFQLSVPMLSLRTTDYWQMAINERPNKSQVDVALCFYDCRNDG